LIDRQARAANAPAFRLQAWDWAYYADQARKARFDFSESEVKPYFEMNRVLRDGVFYSATNCRPDVQATRRSSALPPDVRIYEVFDADGSALALFMADLYARPSKRAAPG